MMNDLHEMPRGCVVSRSCSSSRGSHCLRCGADDAAVTQVHFGTTDPQSAAYNEGANWVGVLFAAYNGFAALAAIVIPLMVRRFGLRVSHLINVWLGRRGLDLVPVDSRSAVAARRR